MLKWKDIHYVLGSKLVMKPKNNMMLFFEKYTLKW